MENAVPLIRLTTLNDLIQCHEFSYGTIVFHDKTNEWKTTLPNQESTRRWRDTQHSFVTYGADDLSKFTYVVARPGGAIGREGVGVL
eukprot:5310273-Pleurochrysis_carterae.AAC.1